MLCARFSCQILPVILHALHCIFAISRSGSEAEHNCFKHDEKATIKYLSNFKNPSLLEWNKWAQNEPNYPKTFPYQTSYEVKNLYLRAIHMIIVKHKYKSLTWKIKKHDLLPTRNVIEVILKNKYCNLLYYQRSTV